MWKVYKVWTYRNCELTPIYKVGRLLDKHMASDPNNIEWNGFYSMDCAECQKFADELNKKENEDGKM